MFKPSNTKYKTSRDTCVLGWREEGRDKNQKVDLLVLKSFSKDSDWQKAKSSTYLARLISYPTKRAPHASVAQPG